MIKLAFEIILFVMNRLTVLMDQMRKHVHISADCITTVFLDFIIVEANVNCLNVSAMLCSSNVKQEAALIHCLDVMTMKTVKMKVMKNHALT